MTLLSWTRRGLVAAAGAALLMGGLTAPASAQTPPGVLIVGQIAEPKSLDPAAVTAVNDFRILVNIYDGLVRYKIRHAGSRSRTRWPKAGDSQRGRHRLHLHACVQGVSPSTTAHPFNAEAVASSTSTACWTKKHPYHDTGPVPAVVLLQRGAVGLDRD